MKTKGKVSLKENKKHDVKKTILSLLEKENMTKKEILEQVEQTYSMPKAEVRNIIREVRGDFIKKLNVLQSGFIKI